MSSSGNGAVQGTIGAEGSIFVGVLGFSLSVEPAAIDTSGNACYVQRACLLIGVGAFLGGGGNAGIGFGSPLSTGRNDSVGAFLNVGTVGGSVSGSRDGLNAARGFAGPGLGAATGAMFCTAGNLCRR